MILFELILIGAIAWVHSYIISRELLRAWLRLLYSLNFFKRQCSISRFAYYPPFARLHIIRWVSLSLCLKPPPLLFMPLGGVCSSTFNLGLSSLLVRGENCLDKLIIAMFLFLNGIRFLCYFSNYERCKLLWSGLGFINLILYGESYLV